jgi:hypothetical protein
MAKPLSIQRWERIRAMGMRRYVLVHGVLLYGLPLFLVMTFVVHRDHVALRPGLLLVLALAWSLGGAVFGWVMWHLRDRMYRRIAAHFGVDGPGESGEPPS